MTGSILISLEGNQTFTFPDRFILKAEASVNITSGRNAEDNPPASLKWTGKYMWNNDGDLAHLVDPNGKLVSLK